MNTIRFARCHTILPILVTLITMLTLQMLPADLYGQHDRKTYLADLTRQLQAKWPKNRIIRIVCHGHSVPAGYFKTPVVDTFNAYPHLLHKAMKQRHPHAVINVIVTAIGGENSIKGAKRFENDVLALKPDLVTIDYGLNDRGAGLEKAKAAWTSMILAAKAQNVKVILLTPTGDTRAKLDDPKDPLLQHAAQIKALAQAHKVGLADSMAAIQKHIAEGGKLKELLSQVNHPNRRGHDMVVHELMKWFPE